MISMLKHFQSRSTNLGFAYGTGKTERGNKKEATMGIEPMMRVLQTPALPLGHVAGKNKTDNVCYQS